MSAPSEPPSGWEDLIRKAVASPYTGDCQWLTAEIELRVGGMPENQGFTGPLVKQLTQVWIASGGAIFCERETRENYRHQRDYWYYVVIEGIEEFPKGLFVEMELTDADPDDPIVNLVNAHPPRFPTIWGSYP